MVYIKIDPFGTRFGNWLFQYAAAISRSRGGGVAFVVADEEAERRVQACQSVYPEVTYVRTAPPGAPVMEGLFQDMQYIDESLVRRSIKCPDDVRRRLEEKYGDLSSFTDKVAVHVRRGDYMALPHRHPFVGEYYLEHAVRLFPKCNLLIFSDDMEWCRRFFTEKRFPDAGIEFADGNGPLEDFFLMAQCGHNICSNSTFSWWAAWLNGNPGKRVVLPARWYGFDIGRQPREIYYDEVEVVACRYTVAQLLRAVYKTLRSRFGRFVRETCGRSPC